MQKHPIIALLEDFRPKRFKFSLDREKRSERYVHLKAFEWVLQRLPEPGCCPPESVPHFIVFDQRDDLRKLANAYQGRYPRGWKFGAKELPSLESLGYSATLYAGCQGPIVEIADLVVSAVTRWAGARFALHKGGSIPARLLDDHLHR